MSVIPFVLDSEHRTVVTTAEEFDCCGGKNGNVVLISGLDESQFDKAQLSKPHSSNVTYDLRVGHGYQDHRELASYRISEDNPLILFPGSAVNIETAEYVSFPNNRFGHIVPRVSMLQKGLSNTSSKIDPGYYGKLQIALFNLGRQTVTLRPGDKFCSLYILDIQEEGVIPYTKPPKDLPLEEKVTPGKKIREKLESKASLYALGISGLVLIAEFLQVIVPILIELLRE